MPETGLKNRSGVLVIDKPEGVTSFDVIRGLRKASRIKKIGHSGTLDPMATGVLTLCFNQATKLVPFLQSGSKEYAGEMVLGLRTDTDDITGRVTGKKAAQGLSTDDIVQAAAEFVGQIDQVPPAYSAVKIAGRPAYELARKGQKVTLKVRQVEIMAFEITQVHLPRVWFVAKVSKGTYVRSLVADLGRRLGTWACLSALRRTAAAPFTIAEAVGLEEAEEAARQGRLEDYWHSPAQALSFLPGIQVPENTARLVLNGRPLTMNGLNPFRPRPGPIRIEAQGYGLLAVYEYQPSEQPEAPCLTPLRVLGRNS